MANTQDINPLVNPNGLVPGRTLEGDDELQVMARNLCWLLANGTEHGQHGVPDSVAGGWWSHSGAKKTIWAAPARLAVPSPAHSVRVKMRCEVTAGGGATVTLTLASGPTVAVAVPVGAISTVDLGLVGPLDAADYDDLVMEAETAGGSTIRCWRTSLRAEPLADPVPTTVDFGDDAVVPIGEDSVGDDEAYSADLTHAIRADVGHLYARPRQGWLRLQLHPDLGDEVLQERLHRTTIFSMVGTRASQGPNQATIHLWCRNNTGSAKDVYVYIGDPRTWPQVQHRIQVANTWNGWKSLTFDLPETRDCPTLGWAATELGVWPGPTAGVDYGRSRAEILSVSAVVR